MTKAMYREKKSLLGLGYSFRGLASMTVIVRSTAAGRHGAGVVTDSSNLDRQAQGRRRLKMVWVFKTSKPSDTPLIDHAS